MTEALPQALEHLEPAICCFMSSSNTSHHLDIALIRVERTRHLGHCGAFSAIALVGSNTLIWIELVLQGKSKDRNIIPFTSRKWSIKPDNMPSFATEPKLVGHARLLELVAVPTLASSFDWTVRPIDRQKTIAAVISDPSLFEVDLRRGEFSMTEHTHHIDFELRDSIDKVPGMISPSLFVNSSCKCSSNVFFWVLADQEESPQEKLDFLLFFGERGWIQPKPNISADLWRSAKMGLESLSSSIGS
jgi:hypothetical protein